MAAIANPPRPRVRTRSISRPPYADSPSVPFPAPAEPATTNHFDLTKSRLELTSLDSLRPSNRALRRKNEALIEADAECMRRHNLPIPIIALRNGAVLHGEHLLESYRRLGQTKVPVLFADDFGEAQVAAAKLWLNRRYNAGDIDSEAERDELKTIFAVDPNWLSATFMTMPEIEFAVLDVGLDPEIEEDDEEIVRRLLATITLPGDVFRARGHRWMCGNSRDPQSIACLMAGELAHLFGGDPPFGCSVSSVSRSHGEWQEGSGLTDDEMLAFHGEYLAGFLPHVRPGALSYLFIDAKGMLALLQAIKTAGLELKTICTWNKEKTGPGGLYLNQTEHIVVSRWGKAPKGQSRLRRGKRSTLWSAPGYATFRPDRKQALRDHACTKPGAILMDMLLDASEPGDLVLDPFGGSGSVTIAAQRLGRRCNSMEIEPQFVDVAIRRFHELTGEYPIHEETGLPFDELAHSRGVDINDTAAAPRRLSSEAGDD